MKRVDPALLVILGGVAAALHVGKLPPALPVLREALGMTLVEAGFLLSLVQLAGMALGLVAGLAADGIGLKRTMMTGLLVLSVASLWGGMVQDAHSLLALRAIEGVGFLLASMPAPSLIRQLVAPGRMNATLGLWGAYMPFGTATALLAGPTVIAALGWQGWWTLIAAASLVAAAWIGIAVPADVRRAPVGMAASRQSWMARLARTLSSRGPWLVALAFALYSGQWLAVIGFLPSVYAQAGWVGGWASAATALAAAVNMAGNIASGRFLQRGAPAQRLLYIGYVAMGMGALLAFAPVWPDAHGQLVPLLRYGAVLVFSMVGGMIPGTLFSLAVRLAPGDDTVSTTVGWMQQWSSLGQFVGPPLVAWVASAAGGWHLTWTVTGACSITGIAVAGAVGALVSQKKPPQSSTDAHR